MGGGARSTTRSYEVLLTRAEGCILPSHQDHRFSCLFSILLALIFFPPFLSALRSVLDILPRTPMDYGERILPYRCRMCVCLYSFFFPSPQFVFLFSLLPFANLSPLTLCFPPAPLLLRASSPALPGHPGSQHVASA